MEPKVKLVWKLTAVAAAILTAAITLAGYVHDLIPLLLGIVALWYTFGLLLERPFRELIEGTKQIAAHQLDFRFDRTRNDEIGLLEESLQRGRRHTAAQMQDRLLLCSRS